MTVRKGLAVSLDGSASGTSTRAFRLAVGGLLASNGAGQGGGLDVRTGVLADAGGPVVTGSAGMSYNVRACDVVVHPTLAQGPVIVPNDASVSVATAAAPGSNSRIDIIYCDQNLMAADGGVDADNVASFGVVSGTASAVPSAPALPTGTIEVARATVPTGTTATNALTIEQTARLTVANGAPIPIRDATDRATITAPFAGMFISRLDTGVLERHDGTRWRRASAFAEQTGQALLNGTVAAGAFGTVNIIFDTGLFTQIPSVLANIQGGVTNLSINRIDTLTTSGARIVIANQSASSASLVNLPIVWEAKQATAAATFG